MNTNIMIPFPIFLNILMKPRKKEYDYTIRAAE